MKIYLLIAGILLSLLNGLLLVPATSAYTGPIAAIALVLSLLILTPVAEKRTTGLMSDGLSEFDVTLKQMKL